jgi:ssDNA-binding Zn-finger/Zn-ribbon topoisomerase 1
MTKTYLNIPWAMQSFAATKGAQRELETGNWFFSGEVPVELLEFVPPPVRSHEPKQVPTCPECGSVMCKRYNSKDGSPFWGCPAYPKCRGLKRWEYDSAAPLIDLAEKALDRRSLPSSPGGDGSAKKGNAAALKIRIDQIVSTAAFLFGHQSLNAWLETPSDRLEGKTPLQLLGTIDDCIKVQKLLKQLQADHPK